MKTAVLLSGGLDSAVLLAEEATRGEVQPVYVSVGLAWEEAERLAVSRFLASAAMPRVGPLVSLSVDMRDVYAKDHWALQGRPPAYHTPDEDVFLAGRNIVLLGKAGVFCAAAGIGRIVIGTLDHNPFPDATPEFRAAMARALSLGLAHDLEIDAPYARASKAEIVRRGLALGVPLALTLSCMRPAKVHEVQGVHEVHRVQGVHEVQRVQGVHEVHRVQGVHEVQRVRGGYVHCGLCSKCRERHDAFVELGVPDPTDYADRVYTS